MGEIIKETAALTAENGSIGCAKLVVFANAVEDNPFMGTELCSRYAVDTDIRFLVVAKQIVFYRVVGNEYVEVTRVLDGRQDYMALLF